MPLKATDREQQDHSTLGCQIRISAILRAYMKAQEKL
jgi:hypothetical protein